mgnify:CR=1 FL=1|jgi:GMP synthase-like glutamine amidotransferase
MRLHYLQHVPFEGLGCIQSWFLDRDYSISTTRFFEGDSLPKIEEVDFLVIMGGPMSVNDEAQYPWLQQELEFVRNYVASGKPTLGVCLGAQLIVKAMGAQVYPNDEKEIGWFPIEGLGEERFAELPDRMTVLHWHGETYDLPKGARLLYSSEVCKNQAFLLGNNVIGLQFHLEMTSASVRSIVENCRSELVEGPYIQTEREILNPDVSFYPKTNELMGKILEKLKDSQLKD